MQISRFSENTTSVFYVRYFLIKVFVPDFFKKKQGEKMRFVLVHW